jgi:hypothetical protein
MDAQYSTVDTWIESNGLPIDSRVPADRKIFLKLLRKLRPNRVEVAEKSRPGPKPKILDRILQSMNSDILNGRLPPGGLESMPDKELEFRYGAKRERVRAALKVLLKK